MLLQRSPLPCSHPVRSPSDTGVEGYITQAGFFHLAFDISDTSTSITIRAIRRLALSRVYVQYSYGGRGCLHRRFVMLIDYANWLAPPDSTASISA